MAAPDPKLLQFLAKKWQENGFALRSQIAGLPAIDPVSLALYSESYLIDLQTRMGGWVH